MRKVIGDLLRFSPAVFEDSLQPPNKMSEAEMQMLRGVSWILLCLCCERSVVVTYVLMVLGDEEGPQGVYR